MGLGEDGPVPASLRDEVIMNAGSRVDDYISRLPDWQEAICQAAALTRQPHAASRPAVRLANDQDRPVGQVDDLVRGAADD